MNTLRSWIVENGERSQTNILAIRLAIVLCGLAHVLFWWITQQPGVSADPLWARVLLAATAFAFVLLTFFSAQARQLGHVAIALLLVGASTHMTALAAVNAMHPYYLTAIIILVTAVGVLEPILRIGYRSFVAFAGLLLLTNTILAVIFVSRSQVPITACYLLALVLVSVLSAIGLHASAGVGDRLDASEARLQQTIEAAPIILLAFDRHGICRFAQGRALAKTPWGRATLTGRTAESIFAAQLTLRNAQLSVHCGATFSSIVKSGRTSLDVWWGPSASGSVLIATDISKRENLRNALEQSEADRLAVFGALPDSIVRVDLRSGEVDLTNADKHVRAGDQHALALIERIRGILHKPSRPNQLRFFNHELPATTNRPRVLYEVRAWLSTKNEGTAIARDVTEQRELQDRMLLADRMASLGTLAAGVAHEINNPLAYVLGNLAYLRGLVDSVPNTEDRHEANQVLDDVVDGAGRIRTIVGDLRRFGRSDSHYAADGDADTKVDADVESIVDVVDIIESALKLTAVEVRHRARLVRSFTGQPKVIGNPTQLGQLFLNLLINAAHAIPDAHEKSNTYTYTYDKDHQITISCRELDRGSVEVKVSDTGVGMDGATRRRIFDPFYTTKPVGQGTGLGLFVCHRIVQENKGTIEVSSRPGRGTTFTVHLRPARLAPTVNTLSRARMEPRGKQASLRILIIDDDKAITRLLTRCLRNHRLTVAHGGEEGITKFRESRYDVILCDLMMPGVGGPEFFAHAIEARPEARARIGFMTAGTFTDEAEAFLRKEQPPVLGKPFEPTQLLHWIEQVAAECPTLRAP